MAARTPEYEGARPLIAQDAPAASEPSISWGLANIPVLW